MAARGLDIPMTDLVINCSCPDDVASYVHRVGRTARAGRKGLAVTLVTQHDVSRMLQIEDAIGKKLEEHKHDEEEVLKFLSEANAARRISQVWWEEEEGLKEKQEKRKDKKKNKKKKLEKETDTKTKKRKTDD